MGNVSATKERLNFRLPREHKRLIERAASSLGQSVTEFAVSNLVRDARRALREEEVTVLSDRDRDLFLSLLESPPKPNEALKRAAKRYRRQRV